MDLILVALSCLVLVHLAADFLALLPPDWTWCALSVFTFCEALLIALVLGGQAVYGLLTANYLWPLLAVTGMLVIGWANSRFSVLAFVEALRGEWL